jgi:hypothetical protein
MCRLTVWFIVELSAVLVARFFFDLKQLMSDLSSSCICAAACTLVAGTVSAACLVPPRPLSCAVVLLPTLAILPVWVDLFWLVNLTVVPTFTFLAPLALLDHLAYFTVVIGLAFGAVLLP